MEGSGYMKVGILESFITVYTKGEHMYSYIKNSLRLYADVGNFPWNITNNAMRQPWDLYPGRPLG